ncbi:ATP-binding cassette domain-containing protein, partial [Phascolarctobacterium succinatutens]|uniref:ATP-binding cassette domain-containing protein n=1 Tax=Phascolarctobacterium succinatutens TaxID=626940 RepID=UPI0023F0B4C4
GENGAGKSTLMNILTGIHKQDKGQILSTARNQLQKSSGGRSLRHRLHPSGAEYLAEPEHSGKPVFDAQRNQRHGYPGF